MNFLDNVGLTRYTAKIKALLNSFVPKTTTINGIPLSNHITLSAGDVNALSVNGGRIWGDLRLQTTASYGTKINLGDGDYVHISEPSDDCLEIKAKKVNFVLSDSTDTKFTINGANPFGAASGGGSGSIEIVSYIGTNEDTFVLSYDTNKKPIALKIEGAPSSGGTRVSAVAVYGSRLSHKMVVERNTGSATLVNSWCYSSVIQESKRISVDQATGSYVNALDYAYYAMIIFE